MKLSEKIKVIAQVVEEAPDIQEGQEEIPIPGVKALGPGDASQLARSVNFLGGTITEVNKKREMDPEDVKDIRYACKKILNIIKLYDKKTAQVNGLKEFVKSQIEMASKYTSEDAVGEEQALYWNGYRDALVKVLERI